MPEIYANFEFAVKLGGQPGSLPLDLDPAPVNELLGNMIQSTEGIVLPPFAAYFSGSGPSER
jgi:hypothetical protein